MSERELPLADMGPLTPTTDTECPSCHGLNISCPEGCGRDPKTGELDGSTLTTNTDGLAERLTEASTRQCWSGAKDLFIDAADRIQSDAARMAERDELLREAVRQLTYVDERFPTGTTPTIITRIEATLGAKP